MRTTSASSMWGTQSQRTRGSGLARWSRTCLALPGARYGRRRCRCPSKQVRRLITLFHQNSPMSLLKTCCFACFGLSTSSLLAPLSTTEVALSSTESTPLLKAAVTVQESDEEVTSTTPSVGIKPRIFEDVTEGIQLPHIEA